MTSAYNIPGRVGSPQTRKSKGPDLKSYAFFLILLVAPAEAQVAPRSTTRPGTPPGREVASVGAEVITLPELTAAVKARLAEVPADHALDRRETILLARAVYKVIIVRSLVYQEARDVLGGPAPLDAMVKGLERRWAERELPALIRREGSGSLAGLRSALARRATTPDLLRDEFVIRTLAENLKSRVSTPGDLSSYLEGVRRRRPITQIMTEAELNDAGRDAAARNEETTVIAPKLQGGRGLPSGTATASRSPTSRSTSPPAKSSACSGPTARGRRRRSR